jgi:hypothetical protein
MFSSEAVQLLDSLAKRILPAVVKTGPPRRETHVHAGPIEAGCKTVIGSRLKCSGMFRTVRGANAILALRCRQLNGRFESYWEDRRAA